MSRLQLYTLLSGGDRRSIADANRVRQLIESDPSSIEDLVALTDDENWLIVQRALDVLEKIAHQHPEWVEPYKRLFVGPLAEREQWEIRLQIVRALVPVVERYLRQFERSPSKALQARARQIRGRAVRSR